MSGRLIWVKAEYIQKTEQRTWLKKPKAATVGGGEPVCMGVCTRKEGKGVCSSQRSEESWYRPQYLFQHARRSPFLTVDNSNSFDLWASYPPGHSSFSSGERPHPICSQYAAATAVICSHWDSLGFIISSFPFKSSWIAELSLQLWMKMK